jgi:hypothetical protein
VHPVYGYFVDFGIKGRLPSFVNSKIKASQDEVEMKTFSGHLAGDSVSTVAASGKRFFQRVDNQMTSSMYLVNDRRV